MASAFLANYLNSMPTELGFSVLTVAAGLSIFAIGVVRQRRSRTEQSNEFAGANDFWSLLADDKVLWYVCLGSSVVVALLYWDMPIPVRVILYALLAFAVLIAIVRIFIAWMISGL